MRSHIEDKQGKTHSAAKPDSLLLKTRVALTIRQYKNSIKIKTR